MTGFNHVLSGITIAVVVQQPVLAPFLAFVSHFVLDTVPHFGGTKWYDTWGKPLITLSIIDIALCLTFVTLSIVFFSQFWPLILACTAMATLPDWLWILHYKFGVQHKFFDFHQAIQRFERPWGACVEIVFAIALLAILWRLWVG